MNSSIHRSALAATAASALLVAGCGAGAPDRNTPSGKSEVKVSGLDCDRNLTPEEVINYPVPKADERYTVTLLLISLAGYYYNGEAYGAQLAAKKAGVDLKVVAAKGFATAPEQVTQAENALTRGTDAIVLNPVDVNASVPIVDIAKKKGVPTVVIGTLVDSDDASQIVQDDYDQGRVAADALAARLPDGGQGIVMGGPANATWSVGRTQGFLDQVKKKYPKIKVSSVANSLVDAGEGVVKFTNAATADPKVDWIYPVYNELLPPDSVPAQYEDAVYVSGGLEPTTVEAVEAGEAEIIPDWPVSTGYLGVAQAVATLNGDTPPKLTCMPSPVITKDDLDSPVAKAQLYPADFKVSK